MYSGAEYQNVAASAMAELDRQAGARLTPIRQTQLEGIFKTATRLEEQFWPV
jgi:thiaminase/transcriptional activator TenA